MQRNVIAHDENDLRINVTVTTNWFGNPFEFDKNTEPNTTDPLTNIATSDVASHCISKYLLNA